MPPSNTGLHNQPTRPPAKRYSLKPVDSTRADETTISWKGQVFSIELGWPDPPPVFLIAFVKEPTRAAADAYANACRVVRVPADAAISACRVIRADADAAINVLEGHACTR